MTDPETKAHAIQRVKKFALYYTLIFGPICLIFMFWPLGDLVNFHGHLAHYIAVVFAFFSGLIFMGIFFYSSHSGGDCQPNYVEMMKKQKEAEARERDVD